MAMKPLRFALSKCGWQLIISIALATGHGTPAAGEEFYIAPSGSDFNDGSIDVPWGSFDYAIGQLTPGDTLFVRGGSYDLSSRIRIQNGQGGTPNNPINLWAYPGEFPVLDFADMGADWGASSGRGIQIDGGADWIHLRGLTIQNAKDNGIWSGANNGVFERIVTRWNGDSGLQLSDFASDNLILNSDSYENYDPQNNGENADGFAIKFENLGPGNVVRGSRAWGNSDDGWDMWESTLGGVLVEDSWAFDNGKIIQRFYDVDALHTGDLTTDNFQGDGNGFKLGQDGGPHVLNRVLVWNNQVRGIDVNGNGFGVSVNNSTVYDSNRNWQFDEESSETMHQHVLKNSISFAGTQADIFQSGVTDSFNTWNGMAVSAADFVSLDDSVARGARNTDGSLPVSDFLRLAPGSQLIDAGTDVGLPFAGDAPDLGAFELLFGDYNRDGLVSATDYSVWRDTFGDLVAPGGGADGSGNGTIDAEDYATWKLHFGAGLASASESTIAVPEPATIALLALAILLGRWQSWLARSVFPDSRASVASFTRSTSPR